VTLGNMFSGMVLMGLGYWYATPQAQRPQTQAQAANALCVQPRRLRQPVNNACLAADKTAESNS
jgi:hypothetical protein